MFKVALKCSLQAIIFNKLKPEQMKKITVILSVAVFFSMSAMGAAPILKLNLEKGKEYKIKSSNLQTTEMTMNGTQILTEVSNVSSVRYLVESQEADYMLVKVSFDSIISSVNNPYKSTKINTNKPGNPKNPDNLMGNVMHVLVKNPLQVKMSYSGKVIEIINLKAVIDSALKQLDSLPEATKSQMKSSVEMAVGQDNLNMMVESPFGFLSGNKISAGDKWDAKFTIKPGGMELSIDTKYKCKSISEGKAEITGDIAIESPENGVMSMNGMQMPYELRGMGTNEVTVDLSTGWIVKSKGRQKMQGSMTFNGNSMPMNIESKSESEAIK
jgi:hypothetical protein